MNGNFISALVLAILSLVLVVFGLNWILNVLSILLGVVAFVLAFALKIKPKKWIVGLSVFGILGSGCWLLFNFI